MWGPVMDTPAIPANGRIMLLTITISMFCIDIEVKISKLYRLLALLCGEC